MPEYSFSCEGCSNKWSIVCGIHEYKESQECPSCRATDGVFRDYATDQVYATYSYSLSEVKTLGHYADKQTKKYGKAKCEDMAKDFKTKKDKGKELPEGMSRMEMPNEAPQWTKENQPTKRKRRKNQ